MKKNIRVALLGNPNSGKTTLFNSLTGSTAYVGNWPGVTVERRAELIILKAKVKIEKALTLLTYQVFILYLLTPLKKLFHEIIY